MLISVPHQHPRTDRGPRLTRTRLAAALLGGLSICGLGAGATVADAQQSPAQPESPQAAVSDTSQVQTVTVTAQFRSQNLQNTPLAITAVNAAMLEARSQTSVEDVTAQAPNVTLAPASAGAGNAMRAEIRGIGQSDQDPALDPGVGIYIDDVYFPTLIGSDFALLDLDRVEILRGPQGTLSGMNSVGGSVKLYTQKATGSNDGYIEATAGSLNRLEVRASADFSLIPDTVFLRLSGVARRQDGYVNLVDYACANPNDPYVAAGVLPRGNFTRSCSTGTEGGLDYDAVRASLRWLASDSVEVNWVTDATRDNSGTTPSSLLQVLPLSPTVSSHTPLPWIGAPYDNRFVPANPYTSYANFLDPGLTYRPNADGSAGAPNGAFYANPNNTLDGWGTSVTVDWKIGGPYSLKSITAVRGYNSGNGDDNSNSPIPLVLEQALFKNHQLSEELRLNGAAFGELLTYTVGGIYFDQKTEYRSREDDPFVAGYATDPTFDFIGDVTARVKTRAGFLNTAWHLTDALSFNAGVRYTHEHKDFDYGNYNIDGSVFSLIPLAGTTGVFDASHVDYRLDLDYQWTPTLMTYAGWSTGFKGGGTNPRPYYPQQAVPFGTETVKSTEAGLKSTWLDNRVRANLAVFYEDYYNYQAEGTPNDPQFCLGANGQPLAPPYNTPCQEYINAADAVGQGIEAELELHPVDHLMIDAAYSYIDLHFIRSRIPDAIPNGSTVPFVGKNKASLGVQYETLLGAAGTLTPRLDASYTPTMCGDIGANCLYERTDGYTLVNGRLTYWSPKKEWSLALEVTNLTNKLYYLSKSYTSVGYVDGQIAMPREWAVTVRRQF